MVGGGVGGLGLGGWGGWGGVDIWAQMKTSTDEVKTSTGDSHRDDPLACRAAFVFGGCQILDGTDGLTVQVPRCKTPPHFSSGDVLTQESWNCNDCPASILELGFLFLLQLGFCGFSFSPAHQSLQAL